MEEADPRLNTIQLLNIWIIRTYILILSVIIIYLILEGPGYMYYPGVNYNEAHGKPYDWRDDPKYNPDYLIPTKHIGCPDPKTYVWPFEGKLVHFNPSEALP